MARPQKKGLDYFPLDVDFANDPKFVRLRMAHGGIGAWIVIRIYCEAYRLGFCYRWTEDDRVAFSFSEQLDLELVEAVVDTAIGVGIFDLASFEKHKILTSKGMQRRYIQACKDSRRKKSNDGFIPNRLRIIPEETPSEEGSAGVIAKTEEETPVSSYINPVNEGRKSLSTAISTQNRTEQNRTEQNRSEITIGEVSDPESNLKNLPPETQHEVEDLKKRGFEFISSKLDLGTHRMPLKNYPDVWLTPLELTGFLNTCSRVGESEFEVLKLVQNNNRGKGDAHGIGKSANAVEGWALDQVMKRTGNELRIRRLTKQ